MKKLASVMMMIAITTFMAVAMTSADGNHHWRGIHGEYAMTGVGTCINSPGGFTQNLTPPSGGLNFSGSNLFTGTWTFERHGHGKVEGLLFGTATSPYLNPNASQFSIEFEFTYTLTNDGTINATMVDGTFLATGLTGPLAGATFTVQGVDYLGTPEALLFSGKVSPDHNTLTLNSANQIQKITVSNGFTNYNICNVGRVLIRLDDD
jgi:hypothetical protein